MNLNEFEKMVEIEGSNVVWMEEGKYYFTIGEIDGLSGMDECDRLDEQLRTVGEGEVGEGIEGIDWAVAYGDDMVNCVILDKLSDFDKVDGLEEFVKEYVGMNCYSEGWEDEDEDEDE